MVIKFYKPHLFVREEVGDEFKDCTATKHLENRSTRMKILHLTPSYYPAFRFGGSIVSVHNLNKAITAKGHRVDVLTTNAGIEEEDKVPLNRWIDLDGLKVKYKQFWGYEHYNFSLPYLREAYRIVRDYDIIHITSVWNFPSLAGSAAALRAKKPYIISPRGELIKEALTIKSKNKKWVYYNFIAKHYLKRAGAVHFTSEAEREDAVSNLHLKTKSILVPNGINLQEFNHLPGKGGFKSKYFLPEGEDYILFLGRIDKEKGLEVLLRAFSLLVKETVKIKLVLAGPDQKNYKSVLEKIISELNLKDKIIFTGMLKGEEKLSAIVDAGALVLPSYTENFGMVVLEAMACGTPVVVSEKAGIAREVQRFNAGVVCKPEERSVYGALCAVMGNGSLREECVRNAKKMVEHFSVDSAARSMISAYEEVINRSTD